MTKSLKRLLTPLNLSPVSFLSFLPWLVLLGWLSSVAWFLTDDAFISFRYTRNLLEGHGLVFNPGEYVEGYTNFLWILELAAIWGIFGVRPEHAAPWLSVAYTVGTVAAMLWWVVRLPSLRNRGLVGWMALGLLCSSATFAVWTSGGGLETRQFTFFITASVVCLCLYHDRRWGLLAASLSLAAAELTRPEGLLLAACCFGWFAVQRLVRERKISAPLIRDMILLVAPFAALVAAHYLFRYAYYGEWLPNTYYAKHVRPWYESGFRYLWAAALETGLYILLPLAFLALRSRWQMHRDVIYALALLCVAAHMAYLLPIGGDHFEYRPLDFYWPLLAVPAAEGFALFGSKVADWLRRLMQGPNRIVSSQTFATVLFLPVLFYANAIQGVLLVHGSAIRKQNGMPYAELNQKNAGWLLAAPGMPMLVANSNDLRRQSARQMVAIRATGHREVANLRIQTWKPYLQMERGFLPDDPLVADGGLGKFYFLPDLRVLDYYGLIDATVAHTPVTHSNLERRIAHDRWPTQEYIKERGVNVNIFAPTSSAAAALARADYAVNFGPELWMPFDAANTQWAAARFADRDLRANKTFSTSEPAHNRFRVEDYTYVGERILAHFERSFDGWQLSGQAVSNFSQHEDYAGQSLIWGRADSGFLTSYHPSKGNRVTGKALSPKFTAAADQYLAFLIAGGDAEAVGLRLLADGTEVAVWRGRSTDRFDLIVHPLGYVAGKSLQLELFDYELGDSGHIMLDHVLLVDCDLCPKEPIAMARALSAQTPDDGTVYLVPGFQNRHNVKYHLLSHGIAPIIMTSVDAPNLAQEVRSILAAMTNLSTVKVVEWNSQSRWISFDAEPLSFLLTKYGRFLNSEEYDDFRVHNYVDISFERPWTFYEQLEPLTVNYDGGIALHGFALGRDAEQLSFGQLLNLGRQRALWGVLQWQTDPELDIDYAISLRLYNSEGEKAFQEDAVLRNPSHRTTSHWAANEPVDSLLQLDLPADLLPGDYELRLVVYNIETLTPTVQQDVWEPEITLARLRMTETQ